MILQAQHHLQTSSTVATTITMFSSPKLSSSSTGGKQRLQLQRQQHVGGGSNSNKGLELGIISGFQWLQISSPASWGSSPEGGAIPTATATSSAKAVDCIYDGNDDDKNRITSSPLMDRSGHSHGSWGGSASRRRQRNRSQEGHQQHRTRRRHSSGDLGTMGSSRDEGLQKQQQQLQADDVEGTTVVMVMHNHNNNFHKYNSHSPTRNHETQQQQYSNRRRQQGQQQQRRASGTGSVSSNSSTGTTTTFSISTAPLFGSSSGSHSSGSNNYGAYELKNAKDALEGSIAAVINFLGSSGVSRPRYVLFW